MDKHFRDDIDFQVKLQGLANALGQSIIDALDATDAKLLAMLQKELKEIRRQLIIGKGSSTKIHARLESIEKQIGEIRRVGIKNALEIARGTAGYVADKTVKLTEEQIAALVAEAKAGREEEAKIRKRLQNSSLTAKEIDAIVKYQPFDGKSIEKWFESLYLSDTGRIFQEVQRGVVDGTSLADIMNKIGEITRIDKEGKRTSLAQSRDSARMVARTVINGVANASRMEVYRKCADVIDGVKWLATLDSKTCPVCGALDGTIWPPDKLHEVKQPPAHPSCRCVLNPYIYLGPEFEAPRAAEVKDFDAEARKQYNDQRNAKKAAGKNPGKPWSKLSYETRKRKRYEQIKEYEGQHGRGSSYRQVKASETFEDYLKAATPEFRREYLGDRRADAFDKGTLKLDQMVSPDEGFVRDLKSLERDGLIPPKDRKDIKTAAQFLDSIGQTEIEYRNVVKEADEKLHSLFDDIKNLDEKYKRDAKKTKSYEESRLLYSEYSTRWDTLRTEYSRLKTEVKEEKTSQSRDAIAVLFPKDIPESDVRKLLRKSSEKKNNEIRAAADTVGRIIDNSRHSVVAVKPPKISEVKRKRSQFIPTGDGEVRIAKPGFWQEKTTMHELGHYWDYITPELKKEVKALFDAITAGNKPIWLGVGYDKNEMYIPANIPMPKNYCTKVYTKDITELTSVFLEMLLDDPIGLASEYPEYFNHMLKIIK